VSTDWTVTAVITDASGKQVEIAHAPGHVRIAVCMPRGLVQTAVSFDSDGMKAFARAYLAASRGAERPAPLPSPGQRVENAVHRLLGLPEGF